jgi:hypothetical protein
MEIGWTDVGSGGYILVSTSCHYITIESISIGKKVKVDNAIVKVRYYLAAPFTIDLVFENCFLSAMAPYVYSRDGRSLSIYGSECQIWKTLLWCFTTIDPNKDISKTR